MTDLFGLIVEKIWPYLDYLAEISIVLWWPGFLNYRVLDLTPKAKDFLLNLANFFLLDGI